MHKKMSLTNMYVLRAAQSVLALASLGHFLLEPGHYPLVKLLVAIESMMGKFALLAALLVASAGALRIPDTPGKTHDDEAVFEIYDQQVIAQHHSTEHGQGIFVGDDDTSRLVGTPTQHEGEPPCTDHHKLRGPWLPGPEFTNLTIYEVLSSNEQ